MKRLILLILFLCVPALVFASAEIKSGASTDTLTVNTQKAALVVPGISTRPTYTASAGGLATTALYNLSIESSAGTGFKLAQWCVGVSNATAAALVTVTVQRRTTASSAGTLCTAEGTAASCPISKHDPADGNYGGVARVTSTLGTAGAILDQQGFTVGEIGAGTADTPGQAPFCKTYYGQNGIKMPTVLSGTGNGISINVSAPGAGGLASGSISATIIAE
jgi:hypothetical protein